MTHTETLENGVTTIKLIGKLLREKITIEGLFTIVLRTGVNEGKYYFYTQNSGKDTVKSPMGMFPAYAIDNDLNYVADKIRNFYEVGEYKTDAEMGQADAQAASDLEKPDANGRRARGGKKTTATATPPTTTEDAAPKTGRTARKTHDEVVAENNQKMADYMAERDKAIDAVADGREEIPFDEACAAADSVPQPELETPPRRTRKERKSAEQSEPVQDGTTNTNSESVTLDADTYFYVPADDNYVMKHKGDTVEIYQKDVNNYLWVGIDGGVERIGAYVKELSAVDNDLPILNKALVDYMVKKTPVEQTINQCDDLIMFQKIVKLSDKYDWVEHEHCTPLVSHIGKRTIKTVYEYPDKDKYTYKSYRVFASNDQKDGRLLKRKQVKTKGEKFGNTPDHCFIFNDSVVGVKTPPELDRQWYIDLAKKRLKQFGVVA